jgi:phage terminase large subunit-like protein
VYAKLGITAAAKSIFNTRTRAKFYPVIGKAKYGSAPYCCVMDEAHQLPDSQQYDNFRTGLAKRRNSLLLTVTTAGVSSTENPALALQQDCEKILEGSVENDRIFAALYTADQDVPWDSQLALQQANPNLGVSLDTESLTLDQAEAVRSPARQNAFRAMHLNQWMTSAASWMNMTAWNKCADPGLRLEDFLEDECWLGLDTSSKLDLSSLVKLFRRIIDEKTHYYAFSRNYLPEARVNLPENAHYQRWVKQNLLTATDGSSIDFAVIEAEAIEDIRTYQVESLNFDPAHGALGAVQRVVAETNVVQTETLQKPIVISPAMKELEAAVIDGRFHFNGDPVMTWCASNIMTREGNNSLYRMPEKARPENKIDTMMALFFAMSRALRVEPPPPSSNPADYFMVL